MAKQAHPDKAVKAGLTKEVAEKKFHDIAEAYEVRPVYQHMHKWRLMLPATHGAWKHSLSSIVVTARVVV